MIKAFRFAMVSTLGAALVASYAMRLSAQETPTKHPTFEKDGTAHVPAFDLPPSTFMSKEAADMLKARAGVPAFAIPANLDIATMRSGMEAVLAPSVKAMQDRYPADVVDQTIAGVRTRIVTPKGKVTAPDRILINLHGGGFSMCADACAILESLPIAWVGSYKVVSVNYRQGPEAKFPAATEDVTAVYRELLKRYKPSQIGIYGCSAGGALSAQVAAALPSQHLPEPGAIGIFGSGATRFATGDSSYFAGYADGAFPPPPVPGSPASPLTKTMMTYFEGSDPNDPLISPAGHLDVLAKFPPTLVLTGTRAPDLSPAVYTHSQLVKARVPGDLIVGEGLGHCYIYSADLPEARDAYDTIVRFFLQYLH
jgi:monoterpene epsilon-lactone hydrolase